MDITTYKENDRLFYKIEKFDVALEETFKHNGYFKSEDAYIKSFPYPFPYYDKIASNYLKNAEAMFYEEASLKPMNWQESLEHFASLAQNHNLDWWTTGKILLPLNGIEEQIDDVDFYFRENDLSAVYDTFSDYIIEPVVSDTWRAHTFKYYGLAYSCCTVCFFVEPLPKLDIPAPVHFGQYASKNLTSVLWHGYEIKIPHIELYIKTLERWGKTDYAESIRKRLNVLNHLM